MKPAGQNAMEQKSVLIIGGGIVGLTTAYALCKEGLQVTILDEGAVDQRASSATAGIIGGSSVIPWASSKLWPQLPRHLLERYGPMVMALPMPKGIFGFMRRSVEAGREDPRAASASGLANLGLRGWDAWMRILRDLPDARDLFVQNGCLFYYETPALRTADEGANALRRGFGMNLTDLSGESMRALLPPLKRPVASGTRVNAAGHVLDPVALQEKLATAIVAMGGAFTECRVSDIATSRGRVTAVIAEGTHYEADTVVLCAGSGSTRLATNLGLNTPMIPAWGASVTFANAAVDLSIPFLILNDGLAVTPSSAGLRIAGLLQVGGAGKADKMVATLIDHARRLFGDFVYSDIVTCSGQRPLSADSLAFLGRDANNENLFHNFGHGHWGLTQAAISAQITADLVLDRDPKIDISAFRPNRF